MKKAVVLFSGGLDSTTVTFMAKAQGFDCHLLSFGYGQKHSVELDNAKRIATELDLPHQVANLNIGHLMQSSLTQEALEVPDYVDSNEIPSTYVPARNAVFLSIALSYAESIGACDIFAGVNAKDYSQYPDCRPEFIDAFETMANFSTKLGVEGNHIRIHTPLMQMFKHEIIQAGLALGVDYGKTVSCYRANKNGEACGRCDSCAFRKQGFKAAGVVDPTKYAA